jgi:ARG/rhodanese/phosphatase superfamily protein
MKSMMAAALAAVTLATAPALASEPQISGPYLQDNLAIFLVHGPAAPGGTPFMTLDEALPAGAAAVYETGDVNNLEVENLSKDRLLFIQAGDIVKGGQQDRVLSVDLILPPASGRTSIAVFCVEHGRWSARGEESAETFASADKTIAGKELKLAAKSEKSQQGVWSAVEETQGMLSVATGGDVAAAESPSSYQLTLESDQIAAATGAQIEAFKDLPAEHEDAIGFFYAINGRIAGGDVYGSRELFHKLWPRLLEASAVEAVAAKGEQTVAVVATEEDARKLMSMTETMVGDREDLPAGVTLISWQDDKVAIFDTSSSQVDGVIHRNYIVK